MIAVGVSDVRGVVARTEVGAYRWLTFTRSTRINRGGIRGIDLCLAVCNESHVQPRLTGQTLAQPDTGSDCDARSVVAVAQSGEIRNTRRTVGGVVSSDFSPPQGFQSCRVEGQRAGHVSNRNVDVVKHVQRIPASS